jgi:hypothetical protein
MSSHTIQSGTNGVVIGDAISHNTPFNVAINTNEQWQMINAKFIHVDILDDIRIMRIVPAWSKYNLNVVLKNGAGFELICNETLSNIEIM